MFLFELGPSVLERRQNPELELADAFFRNVQKWRYFFERVRTTLCHIERTAFGELVGLVFWEI